MNKNTYQWQGVNQQGQRITGKDSASNRHDLFIQLEARGVTVLRIKKNFQSRQWRSQKITRRHLVDFIRQMAVLCQANLDLVQALSITAQESNHPALKTVILAIKKQIENGMRFSQALEQFPQYFDKTDCALIHAGEQSGAFNQLLAQLAEYQEKSLTLRSKIAKSLFYPASILSMAMLVTSGLLIFVVPQFKHIFDTFGAQLPALTQTIIQLSDFVRQQTVIIFLLMIGILSAYPILRKYCAAFTIWQDRILLRIPFIGKLLSAAILARWSHLLATLLTAGIPLLEALSISTHTLPNHCYRQAVIHITDAVRAGNTLQQALNSELLFPKRVVQMISIGESAGQLAVMLTKTAEIQQAVLDRTIDYLQKWLEPALMIILAILTGILIIAMYLPVFRLGAVMG